MYARALCGTAAASSCRNKEKDGNSHIDSLQHSAWKLAPTVGKAEAVRQCFQRSQSFIKRVQSIRAVLNRMSACPSCDVRYPEVVEEHFFHEGNCGQVLDRSPDDKDALDWSVRCVRAATKAGPERVGIKHMIFN